MKILIFIDHEIIFRHFIMSGAFDDLTDTHDVLYVFPENHPNRLRDIPNPGLLHAPYARLASVHSRLRNWKWLFIADKCRFRRGEQHKILKNWNLKAGGWKDRLLFRFLGLPVVFQCFRVFVTWFAKQHPHVPLETLLDQEKPDVIVHPTVLAGLFLDELVDVCPRRGIPLIFIMNSWDNPSMKHAAVGYPDKLLVWGQQTSNHAIEFMELPPEKVIPFGVAQFDVYREPSRISREEFCERHDILPSKRILLYAGSSKGTDEFSHLNMIDQWIENGDIEDAVVVYRPHPWGDGGKGGERLINATWSHVRTESTMRSYLEGVAEGKTTIFLADYRDTHDVLSSVDAVISPLSTIVLEAAMHGKPPLCFLPEEELEAQHFQKAAPLIHFREMYEMPEFLIARGSSELLTKIQVLVDRMDDNDFTDHLIKTCTFFVNAHDRPYRSRLLEFVSQVVENRSAAG